MLSRLKWVAATGFLAFLTGCGDGIGPPQEQEPAPTVRTNAEMHMLRQGRVPVAPTGQYGTLFDPGFQPKPLETYSTGFTATGDEASGITIRYTDGSDFLRFTIPDGGIMAHPDGSAFDEDDSVYISITIDQDLLLVSMEPTGLSFSPSNPAVLELSYADADPDYNGDGVVDAADAALEPDLQLWVQPDSNGLWSIVSADQAMNAREFTGFLYHFSNYTVSW